jgi:hypothetical protein
VDRTRAFRGVLPEGELKTLEAAAYLHDVGYTPAIAQTGFHPLDGARFVRGAGHERLAGLVAYHSAAREEAEEFGLSDELDTFVEEDSLLGRALTYCDLTTGPDGSRMELTERLDELAARRGEEDPGVRAVRRAATRLAAVVREVESILARGQADKA